MKSKLPLFIVAALLIAAGYFINGKTELAPAKGVSAETKAAVKAYLSDSAASFESLASDTASGKYKTVLDAGAASDAADKANRDKFKKRMAEIMEPKLGSEDLPQDAAATFKSIAAGLREAAK